MTLKALMLGLIAGATLMSSQAFAECDDDQEAQVGKLLAMATVTNVSKAVTLQGKQMMNVSQCSAIPGGYAAEFKFNFIGSDGVYWIEGAAKISNGTVADLKFKKLSPNLADAAAKSGVKLASN